MPVRGGCNATHGLTRSPGTMSRPSRSQVSPFPGGKSMSRSSRNACSKTETSRVSRTRIPDLYTLSLLKFLITGELMMQVCKRLAATHLNTLPSASLTPVAVMLLPSPVVRISFTLALYTTWPPCSEIPAHKHSDRRVSAMLYSARRQAMVLKRCRVSG